ncbi:MAG TPA: Ig-like domain-containing protein [Terracidiphilus sp.]|jgi:trimeric autotransporter adhesin|nr:Ig-like domain-containing protein [Terracidiphilus sp.]
MRYRSLLGALLATGLILPSTSCVTGPSLTSIVISPTTFTTTLVLLPNGQSAPASEQLWTQYTATGYYTHPGHPAVAKDLTNQVTWLSYTPLLVTVNSSGIATVTGSATGFSQITASMQGFNGLITSNTSTFTVNLPSSSTSADVTSLSISPASPTLPGLNQTESFTAIGTTGSGSTENLTTAVTWTSSNTAVATIGAKTGVATSVAPGTTTIVATYVNADGLQATGYTTLTVQ